MWKWDKIIESLQELSEHPRESWRTSAIAMLKIAPQIQEISDSLSLQAYLTGTTLCLKHPELPTAICIEAIADEVRVYKESTQSSESDNILQIDTKNLPQALRDYFS